MKAEQTQRIAVSVKEGAKRLGVNEKTLYESIRAGEIRVIRVGKRILIPEAFFDRIGERGAA